MGLTETVFVEAVEHGVAARRSCTALDPPNYPGIAQWAMTNRALRERTAPLSWKKDDRGGFSTIVNPSGLLAVAVVAGDARTGLPGVPPPRTKYPRGPMTHDAVDRNLQLSFLDPLPADADDEARSARRETWMLLVNTRYDGVRFELSCPNEIGKDSRVASWSDRILFDALEFKLPIADIDDNDDDDPTEFDVLVERL